MAETYTKENLKAESRVSLRQIAMKVLGLNARQISEMKSENIIEAILEKQGGGGKKSDKKDSKSSAKPKEDKEPEKEEEKESDGEGSNEQLDALGKVVDDVEERLKGLERQQYMLFGLLSDLWLAQVGGKEELEERIGELEKEFADEGN